MKIYGIFGDVARTDDDNIIAIFTTRKKAKEYIKKYKPRYAWWSIIELELRRDCDII